MNYHPKNPKESAFQNLQISNSKISSDSLLTLHKIGIQNTRWLRHYTKINLG
jgi:hypothetical protein